jgi:hypothetical protein
LDQNECRGLKSTYKLSYLMNLLPEAAEWAGIIIIQQSWAPAMTITLPALSTKYTEHSKHFKIFTLKYI